jgi:hypothetical protein
LKGINQLQLSDFLKRVPGENAAWMHILVYA